MFSFRLWPDQEVAMTAQTAVKLYMAESQTLNLSVACVNVSCIYDSFKSSSPVNALIQGTRTVKFKICTP